MAEPLRKPTHSVPNDLEPFWIPFTPNRAFKKRPRRFRAARVSDSPQTKLLEKLFERGRFPRLRPA